MYSYYYLIFLIYKCKKYLKLNNELEYFKIIKILIIENISLEINLN